jgi:hypothetical protein
MEWAEFGQLIKITLPLTEPVSTVPEPATWAMMILGFAGIGFMAYRRRAAFGRLFVSSRRFAISSPRVAFMARCLRA